MITGKRKLCYTEASDFTEIQGVGNDPIYKRYDSVYAIIKQHVAEDYRSFLAEPEYSIDDDQVFWYVEDWGDSCPVKMMDLEEEEKSYCEALLSETVAHYEDVIESLSGENKAILKSALKFVNKDFVYMLDNRVVLAIWGMTPDTYQHVTDGTIIHEVPFSKSYKILFDPGKHGVLSNKLDGSVRRRDGAVLNRRDVPQVIANEGYTFSTWMPDPLGVEVHSPLTFVAEYKETETEAPTRTVHVSFKGGEYCSLDGKSEIDVEEGHILNSSEIPNVILNAGVKFVGWSNNIESPIRNDIIFEAKCVVSEEENEKCHVKFLCDPSTCTLDGTTEFDIVKGNCISPSLVPLAIVKEGYVFKNWTPDLSTPINKDVVFYAECEKVKENNVIVSFNTNDKGTFIGTTTFTLPIGSTLLANQIPTVKPKPGYRFVGWDKSPLDALLLENTTFNAVYEEKKSWWDTWWLWLWGGGCLKQLLWFLLLLLVFLLLLASLHQCRGCSASLAADDITNGPAVIDTLDNRFAGNPGNADDGRIGDRPSTPIDELDLGVGVNPGRGDADYHAGVFPRDPEVPPIDNPSDPQGPQIIPNVINVFFKKDNANLNAFAKDFRDIYPDTQKYLLDYDDFVKRVSILMPAEERESMKSSIEQKLGEKYEFIIVDEFAIQQSLSIASVGTSGSMDNAGWHLRAVHAPQAWDITPGNENIVVAVVDDGCDVNHNMFRGKIVSPYNVFTKSSTLTFGSGHGTHTAGLAAGLILSDGRAAGIAPACKLMPIQVFDGENSTLSAEISGIAYAIHKGADVVNISMGASYARYKGISEQEQEEISKQKGKVEEILWHRIFEMAKEKNTILVFSAGNDNVVSYLNPQNRPDSIISVTAVSPQFEQAIFNEQGFGSDYGLGSTIASPGMEIFSTMPPNTFGMMQGTSQAAPIVAGTVALLKSVKKELTASEAIFILRKSGRTLKNKKLGPLVQADRALQLLKTGNVPQDNVDTSPEEVGEITNYDDIFRQIREHQRAIGNLIEQLPPEERSKVEN